MTTPPRTFDENYRSGEPPWVIGEPQPAVVELELAGAFHSPVLDLGCGAGEHTVLLHRQGYRTLGVDASPAAVDRARRLARETGVAAEFAVGDAMAPTALGTFATVLDSALFHVFDAADQARYAGALADVVEPAGSVLVLALSTRGPAFGPRIDDTALAAAFTAPCWSVESLTASTYRGRVTDPKQASVTGHAVGETVDLPAVLAVVRRLA